MIGKDVTATLKRIPVFHWLLLPLGLFFVYQYRWLMDDAYVYFRYADNAAVYGSGLTYNAGAFVEGYSSPGWMLLLVTLRNLTGNYSAMILGLGVVIFIVFWWGLVRLNLALSPASSPQFNIPLLYLVGNYAVLCYFTSGLETPLVQLAALGFAGLAFFPKNRLLLVCVAASPMIRPELVVPLFIILFWVGWNDLRSGIILALTAFLINASWLGFRVYYYADLFPNTYHLKNETDWPQGIRYLQDTVETYLLVPYLLAMFTMLLVCRTSDSSKEFSRPGARAVIALCALSIAVYVVKIGGDPRHYRYLAFPFCLIVAGTCGLTEASASSWSKVLSENSLKLLRALRWPAAGLGVAGLAVWIFLLAERREVHPWGPAAMVLLAGVFIVGYLYSGVPSRRILLPLLFGFVLLRYPLQLDQNPLLGPLRHMQFDKINDAAVHRDHMIFDWSRLPSNSENPAQKKTYSDYEGVIVSNLCGELFMRPNLWGINRYGLTDPVLSRVDVASDRPAHKERLEPLAYELQMIYRRIPPGRGTFERAIDMNIAPDWIVKNAEPLSMIEARVFNEHDLMENLKLALSTPPRLRFPEDRMTTEFTMPPYM